ncbi:aerobic respiration two-component sensor histidine kinase ArcB [Neptunicella marina]|uniref:Aerobic respiration control sensor protein n=1 Tax=Neptunicella marina TaxID=2125989 RepID=A0A8J6ISV4_9ALTE|nr:aerobic respiration two-component sensor histidine kinase ArcB [Neptunicella marina]MBC3765227.1 aerobic respiration two-component sensor histidine kinase ArcB [Neptunicella marina]
MQQHHNTDSWVFKFARFVRHVGTLRASFLFVFVALFFTLVGSYVLRMQITGEVQPIDFITAVILTLLSAPWVLFFFSELVKQLEQSRSNLSEVVNQLERLREEDVLLNRELQNNIHQLNYEAEQRKDAQRELEELYTDLEAEIKERSEKEQQAQRLSMLLRSIIDASPDLIYYRNEQGQFAGCNRIAEQVTGKKEADLLGLTPHHVFDEDVAGDIVASDQEVLESNVSITEERWLRFADGQRRLFEMRKVPFYDNEGNRLGLLAFGRDITKRKDAEVALEQASRDKTAFIATISHELRTPLNGIVGLSRMLRDTEMSKEQAGWVNTIYTSAVTLGIIFNDIIDLDKLGRDRLELKKESVELEMFFKELNSVIGLLTSEKGLDYNTQYAGQLPQYIEADATRLRQVLWNILYNAVKFTQRGQVSFSVDKIKNEDGLPVLQFKVTDSGIGIPEEELNKIFAMYYQVKTNQSHAATGTGIGLAICQKMVQLMGGQIKVSSTLGQGSEFVIEIPLVVVNTPKQKAELLVHDLNILLVEDIELNVLVARAVLEKMGHRVSVAMTGTEAINKAREQTFDLILLDIQLPDMTGFDVASVLHQESLVEQTPIVALTANVIKTRQEYLDNGMDDVIAKPIKVSRMTEVMNQLLAPEDPAPKETTTTQNDAAQDESGLDTVNLTMLVDTIGAQMLLTSVEMFQQKMPDYLAILESNLTAKQQKSVCEEAHKIKGAASSIGLSHVRKVANLMQQEDHPAWWENVYDWLDELKQALEHDLPKLIDWLHARIESGS